MKAMLVENERLVPTEVQKPTPKADEVLIEVHAAALNRADVLQRKGAYPSPKGWPEWPGLEVSGVIAALGDAAQKAGRLSVGDEVCALLGGGGYAEFVCAPIGLVLKKPKNLSFVEAACIPEAYATSYLNLFIEGGLKSGQTAFIPAGAGGLSSAAIPLAKAFGARVITSVLDGAQAEKIKNLGADRIIVSTVEDIAEVLMSEAEMGHAVNVAMDCISGEMLGKCLPYMAEGGSWIVISTLGGTESRVPLRAILTKGLRLVGSMLRKRTNDEKARILSEIEERVFPKFESGELKISVFKEFPLCEAGEAQALMESGKHTGKIVLKVK